LAWSARSKEDLEQFAKALHLGVEGWQLGQRCRANCSGVRMLESGDAKSALNASQILISRYREITEANWVPGSTGIRSYTQGAAESRLQKAISREWKKRSQ